MQHESEQHETQDKRRLNLRAGPLAMQLEPESGFLRYIRLGDREILRGIFIAVRDYNWNTITPHVDRLVIEQSDDHFSVSLVVTCRERLVDFTWRGSIQGTAAGTVQYHMEGVANVSFRSNRIGFCVLHPMASCAGRTCFCELTDGTVQQSEFPLEITPHQPFLNLRAISHEVVLGVTATVCMEGDVFETEDQRNWSDASYKTHCTPTAIPFPVHIAAGHRVEQAVTLSLQGDPFGASVPLSPASGPQDIRVRIGSAVARPRLGLGMSSVSTQLTQAAVERLKVLQLDHLRVDLDLSDDRWLEHLSRATRDAEALDTSLHVALLPPAVGDERLSRLAREVRRLQPPVSAWLILPGETSSYVEALAVCRRHLTSATRPSLFAVGTNANFTELNRCRPPAGIADLICFSVNPQVHAFDDRSLVETLETQPHIVDGARQFAGGAGILVSPVTLRPRYNVVATEKEPAGDASDDLPPIDPRQRTLFAASWTLGSVAALARGGAYGVTYYETIGGCGVLEAEFPRAGDTTCGAPGTVFPVYHVLADLAECLGAEIRPLETSDPPKVVGYMAHTAEGETLWLANVTEDRLRVILPDGFARVPCRVRCLDASSVRWASAEPDLFRQVSGDRRDVSRIELEPYALVRATRSIEGGAR